MKRALYLLLGLAGVWITCWLSLGLLQGNPTLLLHPNQASEPLRVTYLVMLYLGLLVFLSWLWKRHPPTHLPGSRVSEFGAAWIMGFVFIALQRGLLWAAGAWHPVMPGLNAWLSAILLALPLALVEEVVFRGYLYGSLRDDLGRCKAAAVTSLLFAAVHLFRPGLLEFKLAFGFGLFLFSMLLVLLTERGGLGAAVAMHGAIISANILDPPSHMRDSLWSGLRGEPAAGVCSWLLLWLLAGLCMRVFGREHDLDDWCPSRRPPADTELDRAIERQLSGKESSDAGLG